MLHEFSLYRSGWAYPVLEWPDNQIFAQRQIQVQIGTSSSHILDPVFGHSNQLYRMDLNGVIDSAEPGWWNATVSVTLGHGETIIRYLPLTWYTGNPSDWHTGMVRGAEIHGIQPPLYDAKISERDRALYALAKQYPRGVWTLTARRAE